MWRRPGANSKIACAVLEGNLSRVHNLISNNPQWTKKYHGGYFILRDAIEHKQNEIAKLLICEGANVNSRYLKPMNTPLHFAVKNCDIEIVRMLIDRGANVNVKNENGFTPLHYATEINTEMINIAFLLLHHGAFVDARDNDDRTPLIFAIRNNNVHIVKKLLQYGADINARSSCGIIMLSIENANGRNDVVKLLLSTDVNKNGQSKVYKSRFYIALEERRAEFAKRLLAVGKSLQYETVFWERYTPLHMACENGLNEMVELLLREGADVDAVAELEFSSTVLQLVVRKGHEDIAQILLRDRFNVDLEPEELFHFAVQEGIGGILRLLVQKKADANSKTGDGWTALHLVTLQGRKDIAQILLQYDADARLPTGSGVKPLDIAVYNGVKEICRSLLDKGADVNAINGDGLTALHIAAQHRHKRIGQILLQHGADVNTKTETDVTPLHVAVENGVEEMCWLLVETGADVNAKDMCGTTALHIAAQCSHVRVMDILLHSGADIDSIDHYGNTALHLACKFENHGAVMTLIGNGSDVYVVNHYGKTAFDVVDNPKYTATDDEDDFSDDSDSEAYFRPRIFKYNVIQQLLVKMQIATLDRNKANLRKFRITAGINRRSLFESKCNKEIKKMKSTGINNTNVTFHDILTKRIDQIVAYARNEDFVRVLMLNDYKKQFPEYADIIESRFNKAMVRNMLLDMGEEFLHFDYSRFNYLPRNCVHKILSYLSNTSLMTLKEENIGLTFTM